MKTRVSQVRRVRREQYLSPELKAILRYFNGCKMLEPELELLRPFIQSDVIDMEIRELS